MGVHFMWQFNMKPVAVTQTDKRLYKLDKSWGGLYHVWMGWKEPS